MDQSYNLNFFFRLCCYFRSILFPSICFSKPFLYVHNKFDIIIYRQSDYMNIKFGIIYLKCWTSSCYCCFYWIIYSHCSCYWYFLVRLNSSSISQLIKSKWRDPQKLLKYFNRINKFCDQPTTIRWWSPYYFCRILKRFSCCCLVVSYPIFNCSIIFISIHSLHLCNNSTNFLISQNNVHHTLTDYTLA